MHLNQVTVSVTNIPRAVEFYTRMGLKLIVSAEHYARFMAQNDATFSIHLAPQSHSSTVVYFECPDLDARCTQMQAAGFVFEQLPIDQSWLWREAYLSDPDGNRICLYLAGEMRTNPPWRIP